VNPTVEATAGSLAGLKGYVTNLQACPDGTSVTVDFVIGAYHRLFQIEKSFRVPKHDLQARPVYHHKSDSIEARLTIVFAALGRQPLDRAPDRLVHQEVRPYRPPLQDHRDPGRRLNPSPPPTPCPTTSAEPSTAFTVIPVRTNMANSGTSS